MGSVQIVCTYYTATASYAVNFILIILFYTGSFPSNLHVGSLPNQPTNRPPSPAALEIHSTDDLVAAWRERGSDSKTMRGWLVQNLKGIHPTTISKVVRALEAEFPWEP